MLLLLFGLFLLTLLVHGTALVRGVRVVGRVPHLSVALVNHTTARAAVLVGNLAIGRLVADGRQLRANAAGVSGRLATLRGVRGSGGIDLTSLGGLGSSSLTFFSSLALRLFLLLAGLPFLADLLELYKDKVSMLVTTKGRRKNSRGVKGKVGWGGDMGRVNDEVRCEESAR